nr:cytochrome P450 307a1-like [Drosophila kikkawai]
MSVIGCIEVNYLMNHLNKVILGKPCNIKPLILRASANMFCKYMCSVRFDYDDKDFQKITGYFDDIFWEINQGYSLDFVPWLLPFYKSHIRNIEHWSTTIRTFILERIINQREININIEEPDQDFTDALLKSIKEDNHVTRNTIIFMLEDFIGGHSAVGNLVMLALAYIAKHPKIGNEIKLEIDRISNNESRNICLHDMNSMPYTMATILEVLRYSSSPIVPHVAMEDTVIAGYGVTKGTIIFINNYILNKSKNNWKHPEQFHPERFLEKIYKRALDPGIEYVYQLKKNVPNFLPFSIGKRTCIGQNLVKGFGFILLANIIKNYNVNSEDLSKIQINKASVALPTKCFELVLTPRPKIP